MRVLIVDDHLQYETHLARTLEGMGVEVVGVRNPDDLALFLAEDDDFQLAFVDLHFKWTSTKGPTGLTAVELLTDRERPIPSVIYSIDEENRILTMLAVFHYFPDTWTVISKSAGDRPILDAVEAARCGHRADDLAARRYKKAASLLPELIGTHKDLAIWRAMLGSFKEQEIATAARVKKRTVSFFTSERRILIAEIERIVLARVSTNDLVLKSENKERTANLPIVSAFARVHAVFLQSTELDHLLSRRSGRRR